MPIAKSSPHPFKEAVPMLHPHDFGGFTSLATGRGLLLSTMIASMTRNALSRMATPRTCAPALNDPPRMLPAMLRQGIAQLAKSFRHLTDKLSDFVGKARSSSLRRTDALGWHFATASRTGEVGGTPCPCQRPTTAAADASAFFMVRRPILYATSGFATGYSFAPVASAIPRKTHYRVMLATTAATGDAAILFIVRPATGRLRPDRAAPQTPPITKGGFLP
jgi:hypothetical protein